MNDESDRIGKDRPAAAPSVPGELVKKVTEGVTDPERARDLRVALSVEGGAPSERYEFHFEAAGSGEAKARMRDEITGREPEPRTIELAPDEFSDLLRTLDVGRMVRGAGQQPRIPPDSVIGRLEISDGEQQISTVFMADAEQAKDAGYELPQEVAKVVDRIYDLAARQLDEDVRP